MKKNILLISSFITACLLLLLPLNAFTQTSLLPSIDYIVINKTARTLALFHHNQLIRQYKIALVFNPIGPKQQAGDGKTPEGQYFITAKQAKSQYHLALRLSYPSDKDKLQALAKGVDPGGDIMIHGLKSGFEWLGSLHTLFDWTRGCIAVTNQEIAEIYSRVKVGVRVEIKP